jgi:hypothetical protein
MPSAVSAVSKNTEKEVLSVTNGNNYGCAQSAVSAVNQSVSEGKKTVFNEQTGLWEEKSEGDISKCHNCPYCDYPNGICKDKGVRCIDAIQTCEMEAN